MVTSWQFGVKEPDECSDCGGSGVLWLYPKGALAKYYSGPLLGRVDPSHYPMPEDAA